MDTNLSASFKHFRSLEIILFIFVINSLNRICTEIAEYFAQGKVSMEAVKGMMGLAKFKSDVIS